MTDQEKAQLAGLKVRIFDMSEQLQANNEQLDMYGKALSEIAKIVGVTDQSTTIDVLIKAVQDKVTAASAPVAPAAVEAPVEQTAPVAPAVDSQ